MRVALSLVALLVPLSTHADDGLTHRWQFTENQRQEGSFKPLKGELSATVVGPVQFDKTAPKALVLPGDPKAKHRITITDDLKKAALPEKAISVEAWVCVDRKQEWGGFAGAFQDNGSYEKGWILGCENQQFFFAVAAKNRKNLTYLKTRTIFQLGSWYHVLGTYDGSEQRLYVDGALEMSSQEQSGDIDYPPKAFFTLGAYHDENELFPIAGRLEQVSIWNRALKAEEIRKHFDGRKKEFPGIEPEKVTVVDWPTCLRDNGRRGISEDKLPASPKLQWVHQTRLPPRPAWPEEARNDYYHNRYNMSDRVTFDCAFHIVGVGDRVFFGSSSEDTVFCLDANTGKTLWQFHAAGPIRLAPTISTEQVLFGCDDGHVYCLKAKDGALIWKKHVAPEMRLIPGNERLISAWPVRTDVLVEDGKAYACAGVFPSQGVYQVALDLRTGDILERQTLKITAQGYLERAAGQLKVSTGRDPVGAFVSRLQRRGKDLGKEVSNLPKEYPYAFIGADGVRIGGGDGKITGFSLDDGKPLWTHQVEGKVYSLAVVRGKLLASTDKGHVYCFGTSDDTALTHKPQKPVLVQSTERYESAARFLAEKTGVARGYCLLLDCGDGHLLQELARRTEWQLIGLETDAAKVESLRRTLCNAGLSGRVTILHGSLESLPFTEYLFNAIASDSLVSQGKLPLKQGAYEKFLRPHGGTAFTTLNEKGIVRRGALDGEGEWTHLYGDTANTSCSNDQRTNSEMQLQWFGPPGPRGMIDRHHRTMAPLYQNGRLFVPGEDRITAVDAYNGTILWEITVPNFRRVTVFRDSGSMALSAKALAVAAGDTCQLRDPATGKLLHTINLPEPFIGGAYEWGYIAWNGETLIGSAVKKGSIRREQNHIQTVTETHWDFVAAVGSDGVFACDSAGKLKWVYRSEKGLIVNQTLTIGKGQLYFVESDNAATLKQKQARAKMADLLGQGCAIKAVDLASGKVAWSESGKRLTTIQHNVFGIYANESYALVGSRNSGTDKKKDTLWYDVHVFDAKAGGWNWTKSQNQQCPINGEHGEQERHPVVVGKVLFCEPNAYDLASGDKAEWKWPWVQKQRRGCGTLSASASGLYFRDDTTQTFDLLKGSVKAITSETRPGCWINVLPVGGLVLAPEASSGCSCNFSVQTSLALIPRPK